MYDVVPVYNRLFSDFLLAFTTHLSHRFKATMLHFGIFHSAPLHNGDNHWPAAEILSHPDIRPQDILPNGHVESLEQAVDRLHGIGAITTASYIKTDRDWNYFR